MANAAELTVDGKSYSFPTLEGSEHEKAFDISNLRDQTGYVTLDRGYKNTGATQSGITFLDGEEGILRYRGYSIEDLASKASFLEVAYLLIYGELPTQEEFAQFENGIRRHTLVNEDMRKIFDGFPVNAHPMAVLSSLTSAMSAFYPRLIRRERGRQYRPAYYPIAGQNPDAGYLVLQAVAGASDQLSQKQSRLHPELPEYDVRVAGRRL